MVGLADLLVSASLASEGPRAVVGPPMVTPQSRRSLLIFVVQLWRDSVGECVRRRAVRIVVFWMGRRRAVFWQDRIRRRPFLRVCLEQWYLEARAVAYQIRWLRPANPPPEPNWTPPWYPPYGSWEDTGNRG